MTLTESKQAEEEKGTEKSILTRIRAWLPHPHILALIVVLATVPLAYFANDFIGDWGALGYTGAFLVSLVSSAAIVFPVPGLAVVFALGASLNPFLVGIVAGLGMALGEFTGYLAGYSGEAVLHRIKFYGRLEGWMRSHGWAVIFVSAVIPNPLFDVVGAMAGAFDYPAWKFFIFCFAGKVVKSVMVALAGAWGLHYILEIWAKAP